MDGDMEAILALTSITFVVAVGCAVVQGVTFWRRYHVRLQVTSKRASQHDLRDLEMSEHGLTPMIAGPAPVLHARQESVSSRRYYPSYDRRQMSVTHPFNNPLVATIIPEASNERNTAPATVSHFAPAADARDHQGFPDPKP